MALDTSTQLLTLEQGRNFLSIKGNKSDADIEDAIESVTDQVENYLGRTLKTATYTNELYSGSGRDRLHLNQWPVTTLTTVEFRQSFSETSISWKAQTFTINNNVFIEPRGLRQIMFLDRIFPGGRLNVRVTYIAGYTALPSDILEAAKEALLDLWKVRDKKLAGVTSASLQGQSASFEFPPKSGLPKRVEQLLNSYRRIDL